MKPRSLFFRRLLLPAVSLISFGSQVKATTATWDGTTDATWATVGNWDVAGSDPASVPGSGEIATFNSAGGSDDTINLGAGVAVGSIVFDTASAAAYIIGSGAVGSQTLTLNDTGAVTMNSAVANNQIFNANVVLGTAIVGTTTITNATTGAGAKTLTFNGTITGGTGGTAGAKTINVTPASGTNVNFTNVITAGGATGINLLNIGGAGTVTLSGNVTSNFNTLRATDANGFIVVNGQTVNVASSSSYGSSSAFGRFELQSGAANFNGGISWGNANSSGGMLKVSGGAFTAASVSFARTSGSDTDTATTAASNSTGLVVTGGTANIAGALSFNGSNSSATGLVDGGALTVGGQVTIANGTSGRWFRMQVNSGSFTSTDATNGILLTSNTGSAQKASLLLTGGTTTAEKISFGLAATNVGSQGVVTLNGATAALYLGSGGMVKNAGAGYSSTINLSNGTLGAKANWSSSLGMNLTGSGVTIKAADVLDAAKNITLNGILAGANGFTKTGAGTLALGNANTYSGTTTVSAGTVRLDNALAAQSSTVSVGTANGLSFGIGITAATIGGLSGAGNLVLTNTDTNGVALKVGNNNANTSYSGALSGAGSLEKTGTGTLTISNASNAVDFTVSGGTLTGGLGDSYGNGGFGTGGITLKGGTINSSIASGNTLAFGNDIVVGSGDTGTFNTPNRITWTGNVSGAGTLNIGVTTTVSRLDLNNSWTGFSGNAYFIGSGGVRLYNNGGTFATNSFQSTALNLGGSVNFQPQTNSGGNTYQIGSLSGSSATASLGGGTAGRATYSVGGLNTSTTFAGAINGNAALTKTGTGTQTLSGTNTYTGATIINGGTLALDATGTIDDTSGVSLGTSGTFDVSLKSGYIVNNLSGSGNVTGALTVSTQLAIGNSPGTVSFSDDLTLGASSTYTYELTGGGSTADLGDVGGDLTITAGAILDLVQLGTYTASQKFTLFAYEGALTGTFAGRADDSVFADAGGDWKINYNDTTAGLNGGSGLLYVTVTAVPEPAAALLGGLGMLALLRRRRS